MDHIRKASLSRGVLIATMISVAFVLSAGPAAAHGVALEPATARSLLGSWTTRFIPGPANGNGVNIRIPAQRIDGTVVKPGNRFSFIREISPVKSPPYRLGGVLIGGRIVEQGVVGGGMCSAATTIFNAALRAGLEIVERHPHAIYISRYPVGLDATVYSKGGGGGKDVVFINDTGQPILIRGFSGRRWVTFEIYGIDDGRTVELSTPVIWSVRKALLYMEYTNDLRAGRRHKINDPYDGFQTVVTRIVRRNGSILHLDTFGSKYRRLHGLIMVGRYPGDPPAGTRILASEYPH